MSTDTLRIIQEISILASIEQVWAFLMNQEKMKDWFKANTFVIDVYEGGTIEIPLAFGEEEFLIQGEIALVVPPKKFEFTWIERDQYGETWFNNTMVRLELEATKIGTKLTLRHDGFKYLPDEIQTAVYQKYRTFWGDRGLLTRLQTLILEGQPEQFEEMDDDDK